MDEIACESAWGQKREGNQAQRGHGFGGGGRRRQRELQAVHRLIMCVMYDMLRSLGLVHRL